MIEKLDQQGEDFVKHEEGCRLNTYQDRAGVWTIAFGNTFHPDGTSVKQGDVITQEQANDYFEEIVPAYEKEVSSIPNLTQEQFNPCVSLCWNIGIGGFHNSSLKKQLLEDPNTQSIIQIVDIPEQDIKNQLIKEKHTYVPVIAYDFLKWHKDGETFDIGLWQRRWREIDVYFNIK